MTLVTQIMHRHDKLLHILCNSGISIIGLSEHGPHGREFALKLRMEFRTQASFNGGEINASRRRYATRTRCCR